MHNVIVTNRNVLPSWPYCMLCFFCHLEDKHSLVHGAWWLLSPWQRVLIIAPAAGLFEEGDFLREITTGQHQAWSFGHLSRKDVNVSYILYPLQRATDMTEASSVVTVSRIFVVCVECRRLAAGACATEEAALLQIFHLYLPLYCKNLNKCNVDKGLKI